MSTADAPTLEGLAAQVAALGDPLARFHARLTDLEERAGGDSVSLSLPSSVAVETLNSAYDFVEADGVITPSMLLGNVIAVRLSGELTIEPPTPTGAKEVEAAYFRIENGAVVAHKFKLGAGIVKPSGEPAWDTEAGALNTFTLVYIRGAWELVTGPPGPKGTTGETGAPGNAVYPWSINELLGWSHDPVVNAGTPALIGAGVMTFVRVAVTPRATLSDVLIAVVTAGKILTAGECLIGVYKHNTVTKEGILVGTTGDQSAAWEAIGAKTAALTVEAGQSLTLGEENHVFVGILGNGTTMPLLAGIEKDSYGYINLLPETGLRVAAQTETSGVTALPASYKLVTAKEASKPIWAGVK